MTILELRKQVKMTQKAFGEYFNIPTRTIEDWESNKRTPSQYLVDLIEYKLRKEGLINDITMERQLTVECSNYSTYSIPLSDGEIVNNLADAQRLLNNQLHNNYCKVVNYKIEYVEAEEASF